MSQFDEETTAQAHAFADALERLAAAQERLSATAGATPAQLPPVSPPAVNAPPGSPVSYVNGQPVAPSTVPPAGAPLAYVNGRPVPQESAPWRLPQEGPIGGSAGGDGNSRAMASPYRLAGPTPPMYTSINGQLQTAIAAQTAVLKQIHETLKRDAGLEIGRVKGWK